MKIKLAYPKIPDTLNCPLRQCVAFEKLDGTNIHFVYDKGKRTGFGTRRDRFSIEPNGIQSFCQAHPELKKVLSNDKDFILVLDDFISNNKKYSEANEVIVFMEWCGPKSFAGSHHPYDRCFLHLIDVQIDGRMLPPEEFLEDFKSFEFYLPKVVFKGKFTGQLFVDVRKGKYDVQEGVVVKGVVDGQVYMAKIKTQAYLDKLREHFPDNWKEYGE
jgi:hypothetical protein